MKLFVPFFVIIGLVLLYYSLTPEFNLNFPYAYLVLPFIHIILLIVVLVYSRLVGKLFWVIVSLYLSIYTMVYSFSTQSMSEKLNPDFFESIFPSDLTVIADWQDNVLYFYWVYLLIFSFISTKDDFWEDLT